VELPQTLRETLVAGVHQSGGSVDALAPRAWQAVIDALQLMRVLVRDAAVAPSLRRLLPAVAASAANANAGVRLAAARCAAAAAAADPSTSLPPLLRALAPMLAGDAADGARYGATLAVSHLAQQLGGVAGLSALETGAWDGPWTCGWWPAHGCHC
jgi:hypothetical protein